MQVTVSVLPHARAHAAWHSRQRSSPAPRVRSVVEPERVQSADEAGLSLLVRVRERIDDVAHRSPARLTIVVFALVIMVVTGLLSLPIATAHELGRAHV